MERGTVFVITNKCDLDASTVIDKLVRIDGTVYNCIDAQGFTAGIIPREGWKMNAKGSRTGLLVEKKIIS